VEGGVAGGVVVLAFDGLLLVEQPMTPKAQIKRAAISFFIAVGPGEREDPRRTIPAGPHYGGTTRRCAPAVLIPGFYNSKVQWGE
jgi:hypothetical protein